MNVSEKIMKKIFSFDAETNGLWGQPFSIAVLVYDENGKETARFVGRCPIEGEVDGFVAEKVLPQMEGIKESHDSYGSLLSDFAEFYLREKKDATVIAHMAIPVESGLLRDMHSREVIGDWDGPFPLIDISGCLDQAGEDPTSCDGYANKHGVAVDPAEFAGGTHNPLFDSAQAAAVYRHLLGRR